MKTLKFLFLFISLLLIQGIVYSQKTLQKAELTVCENTDDNVYPINPKTTVKAGEPIVYQIAFETPYKVKDETDPQQFFIDWEVYKLDDEGKDVTVVSELTMTVNSLFRRYATVEPQKFNEPGKYRLYALPVGKSNVNFKNGNYKEYYGKTEFEVVE